MQVLVCLARRSNSVVSRSELLNDCWGVAHISDDALNRCILRLRLALKEIGETDVQIETVPRVGYLLKTKPVASAVRDPVQADPAGVTDQEPVLRSDGPPSGRRALGLRRGIPILGALAAVVGAASFWWMTRSPVAWEVCQITPVTAAPGRELDPALAPGGGQLVFTAAVDPAGTADGRGDLFLQSVEGGAPVRITSQPGMEHAAAWSPDGSRIAFGVFVPGQPCIIQAMEVPGGSPRTVARCRHAQWTSLSWSPDGRSLYYSDEDVPLGLSSIYEVDLASGQSRRITSPDPATEGDVRPALSRDGGWIAFVRNFTSDAGDIFLRDRATGVEHRLTFENRAIHDLAWAQDGSGLFFTSMANGDLGLWWIGIGKGPPARIALGIRPITRISTAPGTDRIALQATTAVSNLFEVNGTLPAGELTPVSPSMAIDFLPEIGPSDGALMFASNRSGVEEIWIQEVDKTARKLTGTGGLALQGLAWSPDGKRIAVSATRGDRTEIFTLDRNGQGLSALTDAPGLKLAPTWSPDGRDVLFASNSSGKWRIWRLDTSRQDPPEAIGGEGWTAPQVSRDGSHLYFVKVDVGGIWRWRLGSEEPEALVVPDLPAAEWRSWKLAGDHIYFEIGRAHV